MSLRDLDHFTQLFGRPAQSRGSAPGRVNLMGEHTDYNDGYVLPMPIPQQTTVELARRGDRTIKVYSETYGQPPGAFQLGEERVGAGWLDYVQGVTRELAAHGFDLPGFDAYVRSAIPVGAGLGSSAALVVAMLRSLRAALDLPLSNHEIAQLGQGAEVNFVGAPVGIMDHIVASIGQPHTALFVDTRNVATCDLRLPDELEVAVIASGLSHEHATGAYRQRRAECTQAAVLLGVHSLRELTCDDLPRVEGLPPPLDRRVRHVLRENERVLATVEALRTKDVAALGQLFAASHDSLRDDFEVSLPAIDQLVVQAREHAAILGARLTGGGFGGSVVMLAKRGQGLTAARQIADRYARETHERPSVLLPIEPLTSRY